jgi:hypothetical protein
MAADIAPAGDLILVIGPDAECLRIRVNSVTLKAASPVFSAMLSPHWKEGKDLLEARGPVVLLLPDDDSEALHLIFSVLYHRYEFVPDPMDSKMLLRIAIMSDKYDFTKALKFPCERWLRNRPEKSPTAIEEFDIGDVMRLTAASYQFRNAAAFKELTRVLILSHGASYLDLTADVESIMPWRFFRKLFPFSLLLKPAGSAR